jgi:hypothetical protein
MTGPNALAAQGDYHSAYEDLESKIHDLRLMSEIARYHVVNTLGSVSKEWTDKESKEHEVAFFAALHLLDMVDHLAEACGAGFGETAAAGEARP